MSLQDELTAARHRLDDLSRAVARLEQRLAEANGQPQRQEACHVGPLVSIPDTPYDHTLWADSDDEGVGVSYRRS